WPAGRKPGACFGGSGKRRLSTFGLGGAAWVVCMWRRSVETRIGPGLSPGPILRRACGLFLADALVDRRVLGSLRDGDRPVRKNIQRQCGVDRRGDVGIDQRQRFTIGQLGHLLLLVVV